MEEVLQGENIRAQVIDDTEICLLVEKSALFNDTIAYSESHIIMES